MQVVSVILGETFSRKIRVDGITDDANNQIFLKKIEGGTNLRCHRDRTSGRQLHLPTSERRSFQLLP